MIFLQYMPRKNVTPYISAKQLWRRPFTKGVCLIWGSGFSVHCHHTTSVEHRYQIFPVSERFMHDWRPSGAVRLHHTWYEKAVGVLIAGSNHVCADLVEASSRKDGSMSWSHTRLVTSISHLRYRWITRVFASMTILTTNWIANIEGYRQRSTT